MNPDKRLHGGANTDAPVVAVRGAMSFLFNSRMIGARLRITLWTVLTSGRCSCTPFPLGWVATACDEDRTFAMLVCRRHETLGQLLAGLDQAIAKALTEDTYTDEINAC